MTAEQFCLRWNNHQRTLISAFDGLYENGTLVDCTLAADGQYLKAHKVVLCACSPYLEALLSQHYNQHPIVILKDVKFTELQAILEYMYRGEVNVTQEQLGHFLKAAEMLQVRGLTYSENKSGGVTAQIVSSKFSAASSDSEKNASVVKPQELKKKEKLPVLPATGSNSSSVDSLKLLPSKLVLDIPPISPVNNAKDESVSPKRKKLSNSGEVESANISSPGNKNSGSATNDEPSSAAAGNSKFVFEVDPMETEFNAQNIKVEEFSDDSYDSDTLVVDEENAAAAGGKQQEPGPSGAVADGWAVSQGDEHPEATKGEIFETSIDSEALALFSPIL
ncbi:hypothetical protein LSTR_LSTR000934 [Laodelphax striatellus]|uniref:BTB domain-containing protein n=1 Tax=Laodelphax striatellus TaxID=195883 RepID=A0A482X116_LAOST|nr:hypothetical protein LSTR_LSTR000934 [Laodelphax striatellus]